MRTPKGTAPDTLRIILIYALFAALWILLSDSAIHWLLAGNPNALATVSLLKGWLFVAVTSALLYFLLRKCAAPDQSALPLHAELVNWPRWQVYLFTLLICVMALLVRYTINAPFSDHPMLALFIFPIILSAALGGLLPGLFATSATALLAWHWVLLPSVDLHDLLQLGFLVLDGVLVSLLSGMLHRSRQQAMQAQSETAASLEEKVRALNLLNAIAEGSSDIILVKDEAGHYLLFNPAAEEFVGKSANEVLGRDDTALFPLAQAQLIMEMDRRIIQSGQSMNYEEAVSSVQGTRTMWVTKAPLKDEHGQVMGLFAIVRDITERKQAEETLRRNEEKYRSLFENMLNSVAHVRVIFDGEQPVDMEYLAVNPAFHEVTGIEEDVIGRRISEVIPGYCEHNPESLATFGSVAKTGVPRRWEHYLADLDRWFDFMIYSPAPGEIIIVTENINERKKAEEQLRKLAQAVEQSPESIVITDLDAHIEYVNQTFVDNTGYSREEVVGQNPRILQSGNTPSATYAAMWAALTAGETWQGELFNRRKDGSEYIERAIISPLRQPDGHTTHFVAVKQDITEQRRAEEQIHHLAFFDPLTGLPNRSLMLERITQSLTFSHRDQHHSALLLFNIDHFKTVNDAIGAGLGDALLKATGERLSKLLYAGDVLARMSGDEFGILLPKLSRQAQTAAHQSLHVAEKIKLALREPFLIEGQSLTLTACMGVALLAEKPEDTAIEVLRRCDTALHHAKSQGTAQITFFDASLEKVARQRFDIEQELHRALSYGELRVYLQSQVTAEGELTGAEALVRWQHPTRGLVLPGMFIPIAEDSDLVVSIGEWVFVEICHLLARPDIAPRPLRVSVNISSRHFRQPGFVAWVKQVLADCGTDPARLTLEITESLVIDNLADVVAKMTELNELGIHFSMDDFGTGYSSLAYLKRLPIQELKIDKTFVQDAPTDPSDAALVETILGVAKHLHLKVVAEGVETQAQADFLNQRGQVIHQGYLFGRPMPMQDWVELLPPADSQSD